MIPKNRHLSPKKHHIHKLNFPPEKKHTNILSPLQKENVSLTPVVKIHIDSRRIHRNGRPHRFGEVDAPRSTGEIDLLRQREGFFLVGMVVKRNGGKWTKSIGEKKCQLNFQLCLFLFRLMYFEGLSHKIFVRFKLKISPHQLRINPTQNRRQQNSFQSLKKRGRN